MRKFYFKKTISGMVLMVYERHMGGYGDFYYRGVKADEEDANDFAKEIAVLGYKEEIITEIKKNHPELLI